MATSITFIFHVIFMSVLFHAAQSSIVKNRKVSEQCNRLANELDENNIVRVQKGCNLQDYYQDRQDILDYELDTSFGGDVKLNGNELLANQIIMAAKETEYKTGFLDPYTFNPSRHVFEVLDEIKQSKLFQIIQKMPKGGILHAHDTALCSTNYVVSLTYWPNLWQRTSNNSNQIESFLFSREQPKSRHGNQLWRLVKDVREEVGAVKYDQQIRTLFTLFDKSVNPKIQFKDVNDVWNHFMGIFIFLGPMIQYAPVWKAYIKHALKEMQEDGVQYLEVRSTLPELYDLDGTNYTIDDTLSLYREAIDEFKSENPSFIGAKCIFAPNKVGINETVKLSYFKAIKHLHTKFPQVLAGFDLVGQEDPAPPLVSYAQHILELPDDIKFFFHAGESNWFGVTDENLIDAVLLGSKRIGHGYALAKHPKLIDLVKSNDIAVEVNPISNQVLKLVDDIRNHPASIFLAQNIPTVISSDDPSFWEVTPLSHDFYMAFLGIASRHSDLRTLKKFATNSIKYSSLNDTEKIDAFTKWEVKWDKFIDDLVQNNPLEYLEV